MMENYRSLETSAEYMEVTSILEKWSAESMRSEHFEHTDLAAQQLTLTRITGKPVTLIAPTCGNYQTYKTAGKRRPTIHNDLVWNERGLRRGYVLLHEEIPHRVMQLSRSGIPMNLLVVIVDLGMSNQLLTDQNPDFEMMRITEHEERKAHVESTVRKNRDSMLALLNHGLMCRNQLPTAQTNLVVEQLSDLVQLTGSHAGQQFDEHWTSWNHRLRRISQDDHNSWGGLIRRAIDKDGRYLQEAWGMSNHDDIVRRVIDENFGLAAAFGEWLHILVNTAFGTELQHKGEVIILDTIPGPQNPGHKEFYAYNLDNPETHHARPKTPILRPFHNLVLLSSPAREVPYLQKSLGTMMSEANAYGF